MKKYLTLVKVLLINSFGFSVLRTKARHNPLEYLKPLAVGALMVIAFAPVIFLYVDILNRGYDLLAPIGLQWTILTLGLVLVSTIIFYFGIFYVINAFYYSGNNEFILALPVQAWQVLGARFTQVLFYEYLTELPLLAPPLLVFGLKSNASILYWIYALLGYLLVPLVPLALASVMALVVMRFTNLARRKDLFRILGGVLVIFLAVGLQLVMQKSGPNVMDAAYLQDLLTHPDSLIHVLSRYFPSIRWLALALAYSSTLGAGLNFLAFSAFSIIAVGLCWLVGEKLYYRGLVGSGEVTRRKRKYTGAYSRLLKASPVLLAYLQKEIRLLLRTPTYFMNCVLSIFLIPIFLFIPFFLQTRSEAGPLPWEALGQNPHFTIILLAVLSGIAIFLAGSNSITSTSLSREGKHFFVSKFIPLPYRKQIQAKLLSGLIFGVLGNLLILSVAAFLLKLNLSLIGLCFIVMLVAIIPMQEVGLLIDLYHPKLDWDQEQKAVKQNLNSILALLLAVLLAAGLFFILIKWIHSLILAVLFMLAYNGIFALGFYLVLMTKGIAQYRRLEG